MAEQQGLADKAKKLNLEDIKNIAQGACFLGTGGGGSLQVALTKIIPECLEEANVSLVELDSLTEKDWGAIVTGIGSPLELFHDPTIVTAAHSAYKELEKLCLAFKSSDSKRYRSLERMNFCLPAEIGAVNSIVPIIVANEISLKSDSAPVFVVDADGAGRAIPTLPLTLYAQAQESKPKPQAQESESKAQAQESESKAQAQESESKAQAQESESKAQAQESESKPKRKLSIYPNILGGTIKGQKNFNYGSLNVPNEATLETAIVGMIKSKNFGVVSGLAIYAANGPTFQDCHLVPNGIKHSLAIGEIINNNTNRDRLDSVLAYINTTMKRCAKQVFYGQVTYVEEKTQGLDTGVIQITGEGDFQGEFLTIFIENENIWSQKTKTQDRQKSPDDAWIVSPDSMNYLTDEGNVFDNSDLEKLFLKQKQPMVRIIAVEAAKEVRGNSKLRKIGYKKLKKKVGLTNI
ncbi:MAG: DUF917 family protein [Symploca sp. SIO2B6]|nr:DUF917 family protein [Symploca sp. SIO2B6]